MANEERNRESSKLHRAFSALVVFMVVFLVYKFRPFSLLFITFLFIFYISNSVSNLRYQIGPRWTSFLILIFSYLVCMVLAIGCGFISHVFENSLDRDGRWHGFCGITKDWEKGLTLEERNKDSLTSAKLSYIHGGDLCPIIDPKGDIQTYQPSQDDRKERIIWVATNKETEKSVRFYFWFGIFWLLVPLIGIGIGFTGIHEHLKKENGRA